jgi:hypothetical protein
MARNITETLKNRGAWEGGKLLKGSDLDKGENSVTVFVNAAQEAPASWGSPYVLHIDKLHGCTALALNATNVKRIGAMISADPDEWAGYEITFSRVRVTNPQTNGPAYGLEADSARKSKRKPEKMKGEVPF